MESASLEQDHIGFLGKFARPSLEQDFRLKHLREEIRLGLACALMAFLGSVLYLLNGYQVYGASSHFAVIVVARAALLVASVGLVILLPRCVSAVQVDRALLVWCLFVAASNLAIIVTRSSGNLGQAIMSLGVPLMAYCILPLPLAQQMLLAIPFSLAAFVVAIASGASSVNVTSLGGAYLLANGIGWFASWQLNHRRRQVYLAGLRETELRTRLEQTLAEIKTLRGLLPICAWCKRIRDEKQAWQPVEAYLQHHTHAEFSHGICDHCIRDQVASGALERAKR